MTDAEQRGGVSLSSAPVLLGAAPAPSAVASRAPGQAAATLSRAERRLDLADEHRAGWLDDPRDAA